MWNTYKKSTLCKTTKSSLIFQRSRDRVSCVHCVRPCALKTDITIISKVIKEKCQKSKIHMLLNNPGVKEEIIREITKWIQNYKVHKNESTACQNLQNTAKGILRRNITALNTFIRKRERSQIKKLSLQIQKSTEESDLKETRVK